MVHLLLAIIYLSFISLGLPDAMLGASWPIMHGDLNVPVSFAGGISLVIAGGTIISSLMSDKLTRHLSAGKVTAFSVALTAVALFGFSCSTQYWQLLLWAIPYGLGAGSVDACLNNYVAVHYSSRVMSWLHCMWGLGASIGPYVMSYALTAGMTWNSGYLIISVFQAFLTAVLLLSLPLWKGRSSEASDESGAPDKALSLKQIFAIPGAMEVMIAFFCYCAVEQTAILWGSSYLVMHHGVDKEVAAGFGSLFLIGLTIGRAMSGFLTVRINDTNMIRLGQGIIVAGLVLMFLPFGSIVSLVGLMLIGLGCAPIYPCVIHSTPSHFGADKSQAIIGVQMASAYMGTLVMPPLFGLIANHLSASWLPLYLAGIVLLMILMCEALNKKTT
jgi:fucose permease